MPFGVRLTCLNGLCWLGVNSRLSAKLLKSFSDQAPSRFRGSLVTAQHLLSLDRFHDVRVTDRNGVDWHDGNITLSIHCCNNKISKV